MHERPRSLRHLLQRNLCSFCIFSFLRERLALTSSQTKPGPAGILAVKVRRAGRQDHKGQVRASTVTTCELCANRSWG